MWIVGAFIFSFQETKSLVIFPSFHLAVVVGDADDVDKRKSNWSIHQNEWFTWEPSLAS